MTRGQVGELIAFLASAYGAAIDVGRIEAWCLELAGDDAGAVMRAARRHLRSSRFFPTIAELATGVSEERLGLPDAETIVAEVLDAVHGSSQRPQSLSLIAHAVVDAVGWDRIADSDVDQAGVLRAELRRIAERYRERAIERGTLEPGGLLPATPCEPVTRRLGEARRVGSILPDALRNLAGGPR